MKKIVIITGITSGIGLETARILSGKKYAVTGLVRSPAKAEKLRREGKIPEEVELIECDLASLKSVGTAVAEVRRRFDTIDILVNNAGGIFPEKLLSEDDLEMTFAVNHLGHFALTSGIMDILLKSNARIINVSSEAHRYADPDFENLQVAGKYKAWKVYGDAKLFNIYFTRELHRRYHGKGIKAFALHPGVVRTNFFRSLKGFLGALIRVFDFAMISPEKGAETTVFIATQDEPDKQSGQYFKNKKVRPLSSVAQDSKAAERLWEISENLLKKK